MTKLYHSRYATSVSYILSGGMQIAVLRWRRSVLFDEINIKWSSHALMGIDIDASQKNIAHE